MSLKDFKHRIGAPNAIQKKAAEKLPANFPMGHAITGLVIFFVVLVIFSAGSDKEEQTPTNLDLPELVESKPLQIIREEESQEAESDELGEELAVNWQSIKVKRGDTLEHIFKRAGLSSNSLYNLTRNVPESRSLKKIHPGDEVSFHIGEQGNLHALKYQKDPTKSMIIEITDNGYQSRVVERQPDIHLRYVEATLKDSLFNAAQSAGLPHAKTLELANIFGGVIDFVYDPRKGDTFSVLFEEKFLDGELIGYGNILAAEFVNRNKSHEAFRYVDTDGQEGYFNSEGVSMKKTFLRAPLEFTRISSQFNPNRLHPVFKTRRPHNGTDYAAPRGTPVYAAGDGIVIESGYSKANGNYVFIKHGSQYVTKYLHLHKRYVNKGQRVKQKTTIGTVGSTGYATGPHLHYEFLVGGIHRNPRTIVNKLPKADKLASNEMQRFRDSIRENQVKFKAFNRQPVNEQANNG